MKSSELRTGHCYVNDSLGLVRGITRIREDGYVEYLSYWLSDGTCDGIRGVCQKRTLATWANREATAEETAKLERTHHEQIERSLVTRSSEEPSPKPEDPFGPYFPDGFTIRDEANALVAWAFRNGPLEELHAGKHSALLDDPSLSRITDDEMKVLMINACQQLAKLLWLKEADPAEYARQIKSYNWRYCRNWER